MNQKVSDPNYFLDKDFEPYLNKTIDYLSYVGPPGSGSNDYDRYLGELEEYVLIDIKPHLLTMELKGITPSIDQKRQRKYTDVMLVPIKAIVEVRINMYLEPLPDEDPQVAVAE